SQFIGLTVSVTLADQTKLEGLVTGVVGTQLNLNNVFFFESGMAVPNFVIKGSEISDLKVISAHKARQNYSFQQGQSNAPQGYQPALPSPLSVPAPIISPAPAAANLPFQDPAILAMGEDGGWATEDVNDVRDDGEFDFQANLAKFDKKMIFEEIRDNDTTNPNERLVAHNKVNTIELAAHENKNHQNRNKPSPMQKYGNREMIIQNAQNANLWEGIYSEDDDEVLHPTNANIISANATLRRSNNAVHFVLSSSGKQCPCATPVQMVELERTAVSTFGISEEIIVDNAGRAGAQLAIQALGGASRLNSQNHNSLPLVVVLAGNNQAGAKALATGRHLSNHHVRVIALLLGKDRPDEMLPIVKSQSTAFQSSMGKLVNRMEQLITILNGLDSPAEIIIDGIQGYQMAIPDFWEDDLTTALSLIDWANHQRASIISIDIPSGLDGSTGQPSTLLSVVKPKWVLSCGLPLTGIINAYLAGNATRGDWSHYIADVGFPRRAFQKGSMRRFDQIW
ncbi:YjeF N-terminal domain-like protein, partial [Nadsonia fulvescens var. elongata DSM 6958]